jgi:hypothetical protein
MFINNIQRNPRSFVVERVTRRGNDAIDADTMHEVHSYECSSMTCNEIAPNS